MATSSEEKVRLRTAPAASTMGRHRTRQCCNHSRPCRNRASHRLCAEQLELRVLLSASCEIQDYRCDIGPPDAWNIATGEGVVVAVLDTGVDLDHPDLVNRLLRDPSSGEVIGATFLSDEGMRYWANAKGGKPGKPGDGGGGTPDDDNGHGTHVAGIIAGETVGVAPAAMIMPVKVLNSSGVGRGTDVAAGINFAVDPNGDGNTDDGADIIILSFGQGDFDPTVAEAIASAHQQGVLVIASAGNRGIENANYPATDVYALGVGAVDENDMLAGNFGVDIDVLAPGVDIYSTWLDGSYQFMSGTSTSAAIAVGTAALIKSTGNPALQSAEAVVGQLLATADVIDASNPGFENQLGAGRINASAAVANIVPPVVTIVDGLGTSGETLHRVDHEIRVHFSHLMDEESVLDAANYELVELSSGNPVDMTSTYEAFPGRGVRLVPVTNLADGVYQLRVSGSIVSASGVALDVDRDRIPGGGDFVHEFTVAPVPLTTQTIWPPGSLIYEAVVTDRFDTAGDTDSFSIELDAGLEQSVSVQTTWGTVLSVPSAVELQHPELGNGIDPVPFDPADLPKLTGGTLMIYVTNDAPDAADYELSVLLNAAHDRGRSDVISQNIDGSFTTIASVEMSDIGQDALRAAVVGRITSRISDNLAAESVSDEDIIESFEEPDALNLYTKVGGGGSFKGFKLTTEEFHHGTTALDHDAGFVYRDDSPAWLDPDVDSDFDGRADGVTVSTWMQTQAPRLRFSLPIWLHAGGYAGPRDNIHWYRRGGN